LDILLGLLLIAAQATPPAPPPPAATCTPSGAAPSARIAGLLASTDGSSPARAYRVRSIREEYLILDALGLCPETQSLVTNRGRPYDVQRAVDARAGEVREFWFDISSFF
jgi:hypothetical protein